MSLKRLLIFGGLGLAGVLVLAALWPKPKVVQVAPQPQVASQVAGTNSGQSVAQPTADLVFQEECVKAQSSYNSAVVLKTRYSQEVYYTDKATVEMLSAQFGGPLNGYSCYLPNLPTYGLNLSGITIIPRRVVYFVSVRPPASYIFSSDGILDP